MFTSSPPLLTRVRAPTSFAEPSSSPSWYWCMETLTEIGEDIVRRFPPHGDETDFLGVAFVNAIVKAHSFFPRPAPRYRFSPFFPTRYADAVRTATSRRQSPACGTPRPTSRSCTP